MDGFLVVLIVALVLVIASVAIAVSVKNHKPPTPPVPPGNEVTPIVGTSFYRYDTAPIQGSPTLHLVERPNSILTPSYLIAVVWNIPSIQTGDAVTYNAEVFVSIDAEGMVGQRKFVNSGPLPLIYINPLQFAVDGVSTYKYTGSVTFAKNGKMYKYTIPSTAITIPTLITDVITPYSVPNACSQGLSNPPLFPYGNAYYRPSATLGVQNEIVSGIMTFSSTAPISTQDLDFNFSNDPNGNVYFKYMNSELPSLQSIIGIPAWGMGVPTGPSTKLNVQMYNAAVAYRAENPDKFVVVRSDPVPLTIPYSQSRRYNIDMIVPMRVDRAVVPIYVRAINTFELPPCGV